MRAGSIPGSTYAAYASARCVSSDRDCYDESALDDSICRGDVRWAASRRAFMNRPIHFEIPAEKPERAMKFYEKVFGWKFERWNGPMEYWNISTGDSQPGINGGLMTRRDPA